MNPSNALTALHIRRPTLRIQITLLYAGIFLAVLAAVLVGTSVLFKTRNLIFGHSEARAPRGNSAIAQHAATVHQYDFGAAVIVLVVVAVALAAAWWLAGRFLRPLRTITTTAQEISATNLHRRLDLQGPDDELTSLGKTLDDLFQRLEASFESQRHFVANASHELRTPLAGQRTLLQVALADPDATADNLRAACEEALDLGTKQERLINGLLSLAIGEKGIEQRETFDLAELTTTLLHTHQQEADQRGIAIRTSLDHAPVIGDRSLIERLTDNLLENAIHHNAPNGTIAIATSHLNDRTRLSIENSGPLIKPDDVQRLLLPFQRLGIERTQYTHGQGLGLAIVKAIADSHHAILTVAALTEGGLDVTVTFHE